MAGWPAFQQIHTQLQMGRASGQTNAQPKDGGRRAGSRVHCGARRETWHLHHSQVSWGLVLVSTCCSHGKFGAVGISLNFCWAFDVEVISSGQLAALRNICPGRRGGASSDMRALPSPKAGKREKGWAAPQSTGEGEVTYQKRNVCYPSFKAWGTGRYFFHPEMIPSSKKPDAIPGFKTWIKSEYWCLCKGPLLVITYQMVVRSCFDPPGVTNYLTCLPCKEPSLSPGDERTRRTEWKWSKWISFPVKRFLFQELLVAFCHNASKAGEAHHPQQTFSLPSFSFLGSQWS